MFSLSAVRGSALAVAGWACFAAGASAQTTIDSTTGKPEVNQSGINDAGAPGSATNRPATPATTGQPATGQPATARNAAAGSADLSQQIASCLVLGNQEEVALAEIAQKQAEHPEVKKFAAHMIEQHKQAVTKLEQAVPQTAGLTLSGGAQDRAAGIQSPELQLAKAVKSQCLELTKGEMAGKQGAEFDKCYIGQQIGAHIGMLAQLRGSKQFANPQLQAVITEGEQMATKHLEEAKKIMAQLEGSNGPVPRTSQNTAPATR